jgi:hypothetical protein
VTATEKIIKGLKICSSNTPSCKGCPYYEINSPNCLYNLHKEAINLFFGQQAALEKQIPKKPDIHPCEENGVFATLSCCPTCGDIVEVEYNKCCGNCGQKLDWSEEK